MDLIAIVWAAAFYVASFRELHVTLKAASDQFSQLGYRSIELDCESLDHWLSGTDARPPCLVPTLSHHSYWGQSPEEILDQISGAEP